MKIRQIVSCLLLALWFVEIAVGETGIVGGQVHIKCSHNWEWSNNKYFCKRTCSGQNILVQTLSDRNYIERGRYRLHDYRNGDVTVTIKNLQKSDSGTYWCGMERFGLDSYQEVHISVSDAPSTTKLSPVTFTSTVSSTLPNISGTFPKLLTTIQTLDIITEINRSSTAGLMVWTSVGVVVMNRSKTSPVTMTTTPILVHIIRLVASPLVGSAGRGGV
ncbi:hypothetical protein DPEC_G00169870 [Dallia pectoralis]|uniref:Uncharacterized protein n=1 Tax=Dallia pectoralis TaxID=75939 RepID=A0ACC2GCR7_DALPE|nr:hypothetical protein DPEC_G00169870 [Dallia pectoralis]